jgi:hypothetical protein
VTDLLRGMDARWWIAGGWAVDLHLGRQTRPHHDIDVLVLREDLPGVRERLRGWDLHAADPPGAGHLRPWPGHELVPAALHDIWCRETPTSPWALQLMVDDTDGTDWLYRRDSRIRRPVAGLHGPASTPGRPVLAPEVQLLYTSRTPRGPRTSRTSPPSSGSSMPTSATGCAGALATVDPGNGWLEVR